MANQIRINQSLDKPAPPKAKAKLIDNSDPAQALRQFRDVAEVGKVLNQCFLSSDEPMYLLDPHSGQVLRANSAAERFFRMPGNSLDGHYIDLLYPQRRGELYVFTEEAMALGFARTRNLTLLRPDGSIIPMEHMAIAVRQGEKATMLVRLLDLDALNQRDLSEAAESYLRKGLYEWLRDEQYFRDIEREYRLILGAAGEGIYGVSSDGLTTFLNPAAQEMLGYRADELVGQDMHEIIHHHRVDGSTYPTHECPIYNAFKEGKINSVDNEVFWKKDGTPIPVEYTSTPIIDSGRVIGAVIVFRDTTERRNTEETLRAALIENAALRERLEMENAYLQEEIRNRGNHHNIIGNSESLNTLLAQIELVGPTDANVLISGESGTGKELIAHAIHRASSRADRPLIRVNCAAIPRELFESEFFGHVKGSFSGALRDRVGRFELADGGTLFLDEVGELEIGLQAKLLRVVQEGKFERVGEERSRTVDVRLIAATNRNLKAAVESGDFREDLFFRLNVFPIECTPLRQRASDIPLLAEHCLDTTCRRLNLPVPRLSRANVQMLMDYCWPGNIRELQNVIERAVIVARNGKLDIDLPVGNEGPTHKALQNESGSTQSVDKILTAGEMIDLERQNLKRALKACGGKVSGKDGVAKLLGMKPTTVYSRIKSWNLETA
jgi:PAS domain S-box-containing protein